MTTTRTREMTEASFLVALAALLFFFSQIPVVGPFLCLGAPFPVTLMVHRHGVRTSLVGTAVLAVVLFLMQGALALLAIPFVWAGWILGGLLRRRMEPLMCVLAGSLGLGLLLFAAAWGYENVLAEKIGTRTFHEALTANLDTMFDQTLDRVASMRGLDRQGLQETEHYRVLMQAKRNADLLARAITWMPLAVMAFLGALAFFLYYQAARPILSRFRVEIAPLPPLREWRAPWWLVWGPIVLVVTELEPRVVDFLEWDARIPYVRFAVMNLEILAMGFYALMGVAVMDEFLHRAGLPWVLARPLEFLACLTPLPGPMLGFQLLALVGLLDPWMRLRSRHFELPRPPPSDGDDDLDLHL